MKMQSGTTPAIEQARTARTSAECDAALQALQSELTATKLTHGDLESQRGRLMLEGGDIAAHRRKVAEIESHIRDLESVVDAVLLRRDAAIEAERKNDQETRGRALSATRAELEAATAAFQDAMAEARVKHAVMDRLRLEMSTAAAALSDEGRADLAIWPGVVTMAAAEVELPNTLTPMGMRLDGLLVRIAGGRPVRSDRSDRAGVFGRVPDSGIAPAAPAQLTTPNQPHTVKA